MNHHLLVRREGVNSQQRDEIISVFHIDLINTHTRDLAQAVTYYGYCFHDIQTLSTHPLQEATGCVELKPAAAECVEAEDNEPEIDIVINNVVCSFSVRCHLNLRQIALNGINVEYRRENGMITMKLRRPYTTASIWSSGKITCTGATSEDQAKIAARSMPFAIRINSFSIKHKEHADYEPELHPGVTYKLKIPKATLKIFSTGSITVTASSVADVQTAIEHIYPLVHEFRKERSAEDEEIYRNAKRRKLNPEYTNNESCISTPVSEEEAESNHSWD
ncbi:TATA box binding protein-related factor 2 [Carabus blaptoides fortunei]